LKEVPSKPPSRTFQPREKAKPFFTASGKLSTPTQKARVTFQVTLIFYHKISSESSEISPSRKPAAESIFSAAARRSGYSPSGLPWQSEP